MRHALASIRPLLAASLAAAALAGPAAAQEILWPTVIDGPFTLACPTPTLDDCANPEWLETACGQDALARRAPYADGTPACYDQLEAMAQEAAWRLEQRVRLVPEGMEGEPDWTAMTPYDPGNMVHEVEGDGTYADVIGAVRAEATVMGGLSPRVEQQRDEEAADGPGFRTCEEYVREKYAPLTQFEYATAAHTLDARAVANMGLELLAAEHQGLAPEDPGPPLVGSDGAPLPDAEVVRFVPRNAFFGAPADVLFGDDRVQHLANAIVDAPPRPATLAWQWAADQALGQELDEALEREAAHGRRFQRDVATFEAARDRLQALESAAWMERGSLCVGEPVAGLMDGCDGETMDIEAWQGAVEVTAAARDAAQEAIVDGLLAAEARGCLEGGEIGRCDWAPSTFADDLARRFDAAREAHYRACKKAADEVNGLENIRGLALLDLNGEVRHPGQDWLATPSLFDTYLALKADTDAAKQAAADAAAAAAAAAADAAAEAEAARLKAKAALSQSGLKKPEQRFHKHSTLGNDSFNLYYEYLMRWRVFGFEQVLCNVNAEFEAMFRAGATALSKSFDLVYARVFVNLHRYEGDIKVATKSIYKDHRTLVGKLTFDLVKPTTLKKTAQGSASAWFTVVFVPVKVEGGIAGTVGLKYGVKAGVDKGGAQCAKVDAYVKGNVEPFVKVDGFATLAIELLVARAGIKGTLEILSASLPFHARLALSAPQGDLRKLELVADTGLDFTLSALSGALKLWGELGWCPFCVKGETTIFKWSGPKWKTNVFATKLALPLFGMQQVMAGNP